MDTEDITPLVDELAEDIDELEEVLEPLLSNPLSSVASKLPLLDKAKLYVLQTYAIESLLFSHLRLGGVDARSHSIFTELARVRQYSEKIKTAETAPQQKKKLELDKAAAGRFIQQSLAGNDRYDRDREVQRLRQKEALQIKIEELNRRAEEKKKPKKHAEGQKKKKEEASASSLKRKVEASSESDSSSGDSSDSSSDDSGNNSDKDSGNDSRDDSSPSSSDSDSDSSSSGSDKEAARPTAKKQKTMSPEGSVVQKATKIVRKEEKARTSEKKESEAKLRKTKSSNPPRGPSAAFQALLKGPLPKR